MEEIGKCRFLSIQADEMADVATSVGRCLENIDIF